MSFFPSLGTLPILDGAIQTGRGVAAAVIGQTYDVRRISYPNPANTSVSSQDPIYMSYPGRLKRTTQKINIENDVFSLLCFEATIDNRNLQIYDQLTETGYEALANNVFIVAQIRPTRPTLVMRAEQNIAITRITPPAGQAAQQPPSGWISAPVDKYGGGTKDTEAVLVLNNGNYAFASHDASPASIQCGLQPLMRIKDAQKSTAGGKWPTALYREMFLAYIPDLPGEQLAELDRLNFPNSDRYEIALFFNSDQSGLQGYVCVVEKLMV